VALSGAPDADGDAPHQPRAAPLREAVARLIALELSQVRLLALGVDHAADPRLVAFLRDQLGRAVTRLEQAGVPLPEPLAPALPGAVPAAGSELTRDELLVLQAQRVGARLLRGYEALAAIGSSDPELARASRAAADSQRCLLRDLAGLRAELGAALRELATPTVSAQGDPGSPAA
jgi:hypothetical protein